MKNNFKIKLVALVAVFSGAAIGSCQATQEVSGANRVQVPEIIQASEASYGGAFGTVKPASQISAVVEPTVGVPPIISASREIEQDATDIEFDVPPILTPKHFNPPGHVPPVIQANPPIVQPDSYSTPRAIDRPFNPEPETVTGDSQFSQPAPAAASNLLAPLKAPEKHHSAPVEFMPPGIPVAPNTDQYQANPKKSVMLAPITPVEPNPVVETVEAPQQLVEPTSETAGAEKSIIENQEPAPAAVEPPKQFVIAPPADISEAQVINRVSEAMVTDSDITPNRSDIAARVPEEMAIPVIQATGDTTEMENNPEIIQAAQWGRGNLTRGVSAAGVPLYPTGSAPQSRLPLIVESVQTQPTGQSVPPVVSQSTPPAPSIAPESRFVSPIESMTPPAALPTAPNNMMPASAPIRPNYQPRQDYFQPQPVEAPVIAAPACASCGAQMPMNGGMCPNCSNSPVNAGCTSCGGTGCPDCGIGGTPGMSTASCPSCGANGCFDPNHVDGQFANSGSFSYARRYLVAEGLYLTRRDGIIANSNFGSLSNFDWAGGLRLTVGDRKDSIRGREITYFGSDEITEGVNHFDIPQGRINARFTPGGGFLQSEISAFDRAEETSEFKQTEFHSLEFNRVEWGWDVIKTYIGLRYLYIEDDYTMSSISRLDRAGNPVPVESGLFEVYVKNNLIGPNFGTEIYYDVGRRLSATLVARGGLYWNLNQVRTKLNNAGTQVLDVETDNSTIGGTVELGFNGRFRVAKRANIRFGYNAMWVERIAEAANNVPTVITPTIGTDPSDTRQMQFHGASIGFEVFR